MNVIVVGGGKVGYYLVKTLLEQHHRVSVVETRAQRCQLIAETFGILAINGDGTNPADLADAGAERADVLAAVTGQDEVNLLACQLAKREFGLPKVIARVNNPKNRDVFGTLGVDMTVSSTGIISDLIGRELAEQHMRTLLTFEHGDLTLVEMELKEDSPATGRKVSDLADQMPPESVLVSIIRGAKVVFPKGSTELLANDRVMALTHTGAEHDLRVTLLGRKE
jgi:trk system potassium uptake protein TrkA